MVELTSQRFVLALGGVDDFRVQLLQIVLHAPEGRACGALEGGVDMGGAGGQLLHPILQHAGDVLHRRIDVGRQLRREQLVQQ